MKTKLFFTSLLLLAFIACNNSAKKAEGQTETDTVDTKSATPEWVAVYEGILPCADCEGIKNVITLNADSTFILNEEYINANLQSEYKGAITWDEKGEVVSLKGDSIEGKYAYTDGNLIQLHLDGSKIEDNTGCDYTFRKVQK